MQGISILQNLTQLKNLKSLKSLIFRGTIVLGYTEQQIRRRSGYEFIHSADMMHCADAHTKRKYEEE